MQIAAGAVFAPLPLIAVLLVAGGRPDSPALERGTEILAAPERIFAAIDVAPARVDRRSPGPIRGRAATTAGPPRGPAPASNGRAEAAAGARPSSNRCGRGTAHWPRHARAVRVHNRIVSALAPTGAATRVTRTMRAPVPCAAGIVHAFFDIEHVVGRRLADRFARFEACAER